MTEPKVLSADALLRRLRNVLADVQAQGRHARESATEWRANRRALTEAGAIRVSSWDATEKWANDHAAALEQAIAIVEVLINPEFGGISCERYGHVWTVYRQERVADVDLATVWGDSPVPAMLAAHRNLQEESATPAPVETEDIPHGE